MDNISEPTGFRSTCEHISAKKHEGLRLGIEIDAFGQLACLQKYVSRDTLNSHEYDPAGTVTELPAGTTSLLQAKRTDHAVHLKKQMCSESQRSKRTSVWT